MDTEIASADLKTDQAPVVIEESDTIHILKDGNRTIYIVGTAHVS